MKVIYGTGQLDLKKAALAIGIFDGMHRGHQYLIRKMVTRARALKAVPVVVTFFPHPAHVLRPGVKLGYLVSFAHRMQLMEELGVKLCVVVRFNKKVAAVEPEAFIRDVLVKRLGARAIFVGEDFRFGRNRAGDTELFNSLASRYGYTMHAIKALKSGSEAVSSTRIRALIAGGDLSGAKRLLGRPFSILGPVVHGKGRGKKLGFPTANVQYECDVLPPNGVYAVRVKHHNKILKGVANLGLRPSFKEKDPKVHLEVFLFDFKIDLYGKIIEVEFIKNIRSERMFQDPQELIAQIKKDEHEARRILRSN